MGISIRASAPCACGLDRMVFEERVYNTCVLLLQIASSHHLLQRCPHELGMGFPGCRHGAGSEQRYCSYCTVQVATVGDCWNGRAGAEMVTTAARFTSAAAVQNTKALQSSRALATIFCFWTDLL